VKYLDAIKEGFNLINKNWQLVLIQICMVIICSLGFFIIVGIPLAIAFIFFGIDLTGLTNIHDIFRILNEPSEILSKYLGIFIIVIISFFLYLLIITAIGLYVFSGSIGIISSNILGKISKFSIHLFFEEAKRLFLRLLGFTTIIGIIFIFTAFVFGIIGGGIAVFVSNAQEQTSTFALFIGTFMSLILIIISLFVIIFLLSLTLYGIAALSIKNIGVSQSLKESLNYIIKYPRSLLLYAIMFGSYILISFLLILLGYPFKFIPIIGTIISFPYQLISYAVETYLGLCIFSTIMIFFYKTEIMLGVPSESIQGEQQISKEEKEEIIQDKIEQDSLKEDDQ
jgi:hypothetical protein